MKAASALRPWPPDDRLLHVDPQAGVVRDAHVRDLPSLLAPGDVLIVNDAATLPASLHTHDRKIELRLLAPPSAEPAQAVRGLLFGAGDFRTPTELRAAPPEVQVGTLLTFGAQDALRARVVAVEPDAPRMVSVEFDRAGAALYQALYRHGRPIQYAYLPEPIALAALQSRFAARPWAVEMPSAGRPLSYGMLRALRERGVELHALTHAAGLSSTGSDALDARLPLPERYELPDSTVAAIARARANGQRVVAAGTTVVRALEASALEHGEPRAGVGEAKLVLGPGFVPCVVNGLFTGMHPQGTSHFALMTAFAPRELLARALQHAERAGYLEHELGDSCLILASAAWTSGGHAIE
ncbi:MAG TPA: S-adenosylmethionine:tRNA ribosyltransferase-isomerase [Polyangiales bacterium]|nr:S-adenosylmethionine:tRNA ribosyltransferase-isomerase [Polyangiales bacterium]